MKVFKCFLNYDKEEKWLNEMAKKGYEIKKIGFRYTFASVKPEDAIIKIDYRIFKSQEDFNDYCTLFEDSGWKHIIGTKNSGTQYFKKVSKDGEDDIFSDDASRAGKYKRMSNGWLTLGLCFIPITLATMKNMNIDLGQMFHLESLYYTPGLWEMKGVRFWRAFLFETPFVLWRGFSWLILLIILISYFASSIKARILYEKLQYKQNK